MNDDWKQWKFAGIYCIEHIESGRKYVGQAQNIYSRIIKHISASKHRKSSSPYLYRAIEKYGWDSFRILLLEKIDDESKRNAEKINERENYWINFFSVTDSKYGFNTCLFAKSRLGIKCSEETIRKISYNSSHRSPETLEKMRVAAIGRKASEETRKKISIKNKGRRHTDETKKKISIKNKGRVVSDKTKEMMRIINTGRKASEETRKKISISQIGKHTKDNLLKANEATRKSVIQIDSTGVIEIKRFNSIADAAREIGGCIGNISLCCREKRKRAYGFCWRYADDLIKPINVISSKLIQVYQIDRRSNEIIKKWSSIIEAADALGIRSNGISAVCNKRSKSCGGFYWKYVNEKEKIQTIKRKKWNKRPVYQIDMHTNQLINKWDSIADAIRGLNITGSNHISACCSGKLNYSHGYIWKYVDQVESENLNVT